MYKYDYTVSGHMVGISQIGLFTVIHVIHTYIYCYNQSYHTKTKLPIFSHCSDAKKTTMFLKVKDITRNNDV